MKSVSFNIVVLRHAQTEYGEKRKLMGLLDMPCSERGRAQARAVGKNIGKRPYLRIYSSPLERAVQTARDVFQREPTIEDSLRERNLGTWAGKRIEDLLKECPDAFLESGHLDPYYTPRNGEPIEDMIARVRVFLMKLHDLHDAVALEQANKGPLWIAIVTHNGVIRVFRHLVEHIGLYNMYNQAEPHLSPINYTYNGVDWKFGGLP